VSAVLTNCGDEHLQHGMISSRSARSRRPGFGTSLVGDVADVGDTTADNVSTMGQKVLDNDVVDTRIWA
jgi:hypothetical protein